METFYLACFLFGLGMVVVSTLMGAAHMALPGAHDGFHIGHNGHAGNGGGHNAGGHTGAHNGHGADGDGHSGGWPLWNLSTLLAFLMWFGAAGYIATRYAGFPAQLALMPGVLFGAAGGLLVSWFLRFVLRGETEMDPRAYRMEGTLARVSIGIPDGGTGEIIYSKGETRRGEGARSIDGRPIARGEEVVVLDYQRGIALVQTWQDFRDDGVHRMPAEDADRSERAAAQGEG